MVIEPDWQAPDNIRAFTTLKPANGSLSTTAGLLNPNCRLYPMKQVHGTAVIDVGNCVGEPCADACFSRARYHACQVLTADCLPILVCNDAGAEIAAMHAGWRGLQAGVIEATLECLQSPVSQLMAWLGPAISQQCFEVGPEVREAFLQSCTRDSRDETEACFLSGRGDRYLADLYGLARVRLRGLGVRRIYGGDFCTYTDSMRFHSWRRDGESAGRMASVIAIY